MPSSGHEERPIAVQLWSFREDLRHNAERTLAGIRDLGIRHLELAGTGDCSPNEFREICDRLGLVVFGVHQPSLTSGDLTRLVREAKLHCELLGAKYVTVMLDPAQRSRPDAYLEYADLCSRAGDSLGENGIVLCYHCYHYDYASLGSAVREQTGLDLLLDNTLPEHLSFEIDTYFLHFGGRSLEDVLNKCGNRCKLVHLNDITADGQQCPLGHGTIHWPNARRVIARESNPEWLILEHDCPEPFAWIKQSHDYWKTTELL